MNLIKSLLWIMTGCRLGFFGISAGTAIGIGAAGVGALANGLSSNASSKEGQKASWMAYMRQLQGLQSAGNQFQNARDTQNWGAGNTYDLTNGYNSERLNINKDLQNLTYNNNMDGLNNTYNSQNTANQGSYDALMQGNQGTYDALMKGNQGAYDAQMAAANGQEGNYKEAFQGIKNHLNPYMQAGTTALSSQQDLLGLNGKAAQDAAYAGIQNGQYNNMLKQSENTLLQNSSATGGIRGGNAAAALAQLAPAQMQNAIDSRSAQYAGLTNTGLDATKTFSGYRSDLGQQLAGLNQERGQYGATYNMNNGQYGAAYNTNKGQYGANLANRTGDINTQYYQGLQGYNNQNVGQQHQNALDYLTGNTNAGINYGNSITNNNSDYYNNLAGLYQQAGSGGSQQALQAGGYKQAGIMGIGNAISSGVGTLAGLYSAYNSGGGSYGNYGNGGYGGGYGGGTNWNNYGGGNGGNGYGFSGLRYNNG